MTLIGTHTFEEGSDGGAVASGSNGVVAISGTPLYQTASAVHGSLGVAVGSNGAVNYASGAAGSIDCYFRETTIGSGSSILVGLKNTSTHVGRIRWNTTGNHFEIADAGSTVQATSTTSVPAANTPFRLLVTYTSTSSSITCDVYIFVTTLEGYQWDEHITATFATSSVINRISVGNTSVGWGTDVDTVRLYDNQYVPVPYGSAAANNSGRPVATPSNTGWTAVGAATPHAAMADESDTTYALSGGSGSTALRERISRVNQPTASALKLRVKAMASDQLFTVVLDENGTTRQTWTGVQALASGWTDLNLTLDAGGLAIVDWEGVYFTATATA